MDAYQIGCPRGCFHSLAEQITCELMYDVDDRPSEDEQQRGKLVNFTHGERAEQSGRGTRSDIYHV